MHALELLPVQAEARGAVPEEALDSAVQRVRALSRLTGGDAEFATVKLTAARSPASHYPALAQASLRAHGTIIRVRAEADTMPRAIARMSERLRSRLERSQRH